MTHTGHRRDSFAATHYAAFGTMCKLEACTFAFKFAGLRGVTMAQKLSGGCACGAIHYECSAESSQDVELSLSGLPTGERQCLRCDRCSAEDRRSDSWRAALSQGCRQGWQGSRARLLPELR